MWQHHNTRNWTLVLPQNIRHGTQNNGSVSEHNLNITFLHVEVIRQFGKSTSMPLVTNKRLCAVRHFLDMQHKIRAHPGLDKHNNTLTYVTIV